MVLAARRWGDTSGAAMASAARALRAFLFREGDHVDQDAGAYLFALFFADIQFIARAHSKEAEKP